VRAVRLIECLAATAEAPSFAQDRLRLSKSRSRGSVNNQARQNLLSPRAYNVGGETNKTYALPGNRKAAKMVTRLIEECFDNAYAYKPQYHALGHALTNAIFYLDYHRKGFDARDGSMPETAVLLPGALPVRQHFTPRTHAVAPDEDA
jgi:hypothetical protein